MELYESRTLFRLSALSTTLARLTYAGLEAVSLEAADPILDGMGSQVAPYYAPGCKVLLDKLMQLYYYYDDQDLA